MSRPVLLSSRPSSASIEPRQVTALEYPHGDLERHWPTDSRVVTTVQVSNHGRSFTCAGRSRP